MNHVAALLLRALALCAAVLGTGLVAGESPSTPVRVELPVFLKAFREGRISEGRAQYPNGTVDFVRLSGTYQPAASSVPTTAADDAVAAQAAPTPVVVWTAEGVIEKAEAIELRDAGFVHVSTAEAHARFLEDVRRAIAEEAARRTVSEKATAAMRVVGPILLVIAALVAFLFIFRRVQGGMAQWKTGVRRTPPNVIRFSSVAGCDEAKVEVHEVVDYLRNPAKFSGLGARVPRGVLLVGPPGTGKTLLAKAVAGEAGVPFFSVSGSDFVEVFVGVGPARVKQLFKQARKAAPAIIFIDEIDAVGARRTEGGGAAREDNRTLNALLTEMDGFTADSSVIVFAATNRLDTLDPALRRPGRFDRTVHVGLPDLRGREDILRVYLPRIKLADDVSAGRLAAMTAGFSGADLANLVNEAAIHAGRNSHVAVTQADFQEASEKLAMGAQRRKPMTPLERRTVACHEAGHALMRVLDGESDVRLQKVTIIPRGESLGSTYFAPERDLLNHTESQLEARIRCLMAGRVAEELLMGQITSGASGDIQQATAIARSMVLALGMSGLGFAAIGAHGEREGIMSAPVVAQAEERILALLSRLYAETRQRLESHRDCLVAITEALCERETISGDEVRAMAAIPV